MSAPFSQVNKRLKPESELARHLITLVFEVLGHSGQHGRVSVGSGTTVALKALGKPLARLPSGPDEYFWVLLEIRDRKRLAFRARIMITENGRELDAIHFRPGAWIEELIEYLDQAP